MVPVWAIKAGAVLALVAGVWLHGRHVGAEGVTEDWAASDRAREEAEIQAARDRAKTAQAAATDFEGRRARIAADLAGARADLRKALQRPICPPGGSAETSDVQTLDSLPIPAAAVDRLRRAGSDGGAG